MNKYVLRNVYKKVLIFPLNSTFSSHQHIHNSQATATTTNFYLFINSTLKTFKMTDAQVAGGHKAVINNPNVPEETKEHSREVLEKEFDGGDVAKADDNQEKNPNNVAGGLKATLNNPNVSDEAKKNAQERLDKEDF